MKTVFSGITKRKIYFSQADVSEVKTILEKHGYYQKLSIKGKIKFLKRVITFIVNKEFMGMEGLVVSREMQVWVAAAAVQLTFGLNQFRLMHFHTIKLFPESFYFRLYEKYLKGGTSMNGYIFLSWKDLKQGFIVADDRYNLGLHEMAHALKIDALHGDDFDELFSDRLEEWLENGSMEMIRMREGGTNFLRDYAKTNLHEFFAVCVEHFFEVSAEFKKAMPELYEGLCVLLNQDPLNETKDFIYTGKHSL